MLVSYIIGDDIVIPPPKAAGYGSRISFAGLLSQFQRAEIGRTTSHARMQTSPTCPIMMHRYAGNAQNQLSAHKLLQICRIFADRCLAQCFVVFLALVAVFVALSIVPFFAVFLVFIRVILTKARTFDPSFRCASYTPKPAGRVAVYGISSTSRAICTRCRPVREDSSIHNGGAKLDKCRQRS